MRIHAAVRFEIEWTGAEVDYILQANDLHEERHGHGLDSMDAGDATGAILEWAQDLFLKPGPLRDEGEFSIVVANMLGEDSVLTVTAEVEIPFRYEGAWK